MDVDPLRVIEMLKHKIADLAAEAAVLSAAVEQAEAQLAEARQRTAELEAKLTAAEIFERGENNPT